MNTRYELTADETESLMEQYAEDFQTMGEFNQVRDEATEAVNNGVILLDASVADWASMVPPTFDVDAVNNCIVVHVFGTPAGVPNYHQALVELFRVTGVNEQTFDACDYGFDFNHICGGKFGNILWRKAIADRIK